LTDILAGAFASEGNAIVDKIDGPPKSLAECLTICMTAP
jgi:hypothetical protein